MDQQHWATSPVTLRGRTLSKYKPSVSCKSDRNFDQHERVWSSLSKEANKVHTIALILVVIVIQAVKVFFERWKFQFLEYSPPPLREVRRTVEPA